MLGDVHRRAELAHRPGAQQQVVAVCGVRHDGDPGPLFLHSDGEKGEIQRQYEAPDPDPEEEFIRKEKMQRLNEAVENLPPHYRIMLVLRHQENLSYEEIADSLDIPLGTVKARIHRAREMLKSSLKGKDFF